jgi:hypothetical protein
MMISLSPYCTLSSSSSSPFYFFFLIRPLDEIKRRKSLRVWNEGKRYIYILKHGNAAAVSDYGSSGWCSLWLLFIDFRFGPVQFPFQMRIYINLFSFPFSTFFFFFFFTSSLRYFSALTLSASCAPMQQ